MRGSHQQFLICLFRFPLFHISFDAARFTSLMPHFSGAGGEVEVECCRTTVVGWFNDNVQKTTDGVGLCVGLYDEGIGIGAVGITRVATKTGVGIDECSAGKLFEAAGVN